MAAEQQSGFQVLGFGFQKVSPMVMAMLGLSELETLNLKLETDIQPGNPQEQKNLPRWFSGGLGSV
jgi:hypothetical protein